MKEKKETPAEKPETAENNKKTKNLISAVILLSGLFIGSLFVDAIQLLRGGGFSQKTLSENEVLEAGGKTWVAFSDPVIEMKVINDDACEKCDVSDVLVWLRRVSPTVRPQRIAYDSMEGKEIILKYGIKTLPTFIFSDTIAKTDFFAQAQPIFEQKEKQYVLKTQELGLMPGKYLALPEIKNDDATAGDPESKVKIFVYSDFECPYCKVFWMTLRETMQEFGERAFFNYKHLALPNHPQAENAALAAECAREQGKFWEYGDKVFASQADWTKSSGTQRFKNYASVLKLNSVQFTQCLDDKKYKAKIDADKSEAGSFGIAGTPAIFINDRLESGAIGKDDLKRAIEEELNK